jgi:organic hydroperoxide reductase OsmC/OhrA
VADPANRVKTLHLYTAHIEWQRGEEVFVDNRYSRRHLWRFDGGAEVPGSSSALSVPVPMSDPSAVDPEEAFVASISSCHMLWFLGLAAKRKFRVDRYTDDAEGVMEKNAEGRVAITRVTLHPAVAFSGEHHPSPDELAHLHHEAHEKCFIANSVKTDIRIEPK